MQALKLKKLHDRAELPRYSTPGAACFDIKAIVDGPPVSIFQDVPVTFGTGIAAEIEPGWALLLFSRSGHGFNNDTRLSNCVGVIDSDYRGEIMVKLQRDATTGKGMTVSDGDRIVQGLIVKAEQVSFFFDEELSETERGDGGLGSTGN